MVLNRLRPFSEVSGSDVAGELLELVPVVVVIELPVEGDAVKTQPFDGLYDVRHGRNGLSCT